MNNSTETELPKRWFAARIVSGESIIDKQLALDGVRCYRTRYAGAILFLHCTLQYSSALISSYWGRIFFYLDPERHHPAAIPDRQMENFILVTSLSDELISLGKVTPDFLVGERVRVKEGVFKGAEGVIKRIKGDRRLIVSIDGITAVATCYIRPDFLERIEG